MAVVLVILVKHASVLVALARELPIVRLRNHVIFVHQKALVCGAE